MRIDGLQNKFEIFQQFYYEINGVEITYNEAVKLYYKMDEATQISFAQFCADKVEYQIIDGDSDVFAYITSASGYNIDKPMTKEYSKSLIGQDYSIRAYAAKNGLVLDQQWSQFSAKEIIQMVNDGVNVPQEIVNIAHTILQSQTSNLEGVEGERIEGNVNGAEKTEKETFLELIPKAKKNIDKCHDKEAKIDDKITDLVQNNGGIQKSFEDKMEEQKTILKEYEEKIREWRILQNKINNGEELSDTEASKYAQITGMLEDKNHSSSEFKLDKLSIARNLNEINILAVLGEQLADETIKIGDQLADYTSESNYKATRDHITGEIGFLRAITAMLNGKTLAKEANKVGHETKEYTKDTSDSVKDIAGLLGVEKIIANPSTQPKEDASEDVKKTEEQKEEDPQTKETLPLTEDTKESEKAAEQENDSIEEDFIINDENVLDLIDSGMEINADLLNQIKTAFDNIDKSEDYKAFAKAANVVISKIVEEYRKEEDERQKEIAERQEEIDRAQEKIEELGGGEDAEEMQEIAAQVGQDKNENQNEIDEQEAIIDINTSIIENLNAESEAQIETIKNETNKVKEQLDKAIPEEDKALENDKEYKDEIIPEDKEQLAFTLSSGKTLYKMGTYRVKVGMEQISHWQFKKGFENITKGTISEEIGNNAVVISELPIVQNAEKATEVSVGSEEEANKLMAEVDNKIIEVTGGKSAKESVPAEEDEKQDDVAEEEENNAEGSDKNVKTTEVTSDKSTKTAANTTLHLSVAKTNKTSQKSRGEKIKEAKDAESADKDEKVPLEMLPKRKKKNKEEKITNTDQAQDSVDDIAKDGKDSAKDSEKVLKDTQKDEKQLDKESKKLQKQMKKDEKEIKRLTKESLNAAKKQEEILKKYEKLTKENDAIAEEEANKKATASGQQPAAQGAQIDPQNNGMAGTTNSFGITDSSKASSAENAKKMEANNQEITVLSGQFNIAGNKIKRNRKKIVKLQKSTKKNVKKVEKKTKLREEKIKEAEKKEMEKQKKLAKQLASVGVAENVFSITLATGELMLLSPWTHAAGLILVKIGTYGIISCGLTKAIINLANGNLTAALIGLGQTAVSAVAAMTGAGAGATNVLQAVSAGLSVVSSSAQLVNNIRTLQGKEAGGALSMISTIAGVASSVASAGAGFMGTKNFKTKDTFSSAFSEASSLGKLAQIANVAGTTISSVGQIMSEFGGNSGAADILSTIGGAINLAASVTQMTLKKGNMDAKNKENTDKVKQNAATNTNNTNNNNATQRNNKTGNTPDSLPKQAKPDTPNSSTPEIAVPKKDNSVSNNTASTTTNSQTKGTTLPNTNKTQTFNNNGTNFDMQKFGYKALMAGNNSFTNGLSFGNFSSNLNFQKFGTQNFMTSGLSFNRFSFAGLNNGLNTPKFGLGGFLSGNNKNLFNISLPPLNFKSPFASTQNAAAGDMYGEQAYTNPIITFGNTDASLLNPSAMSDSNLSSADTAEKLEITALNNDNKEGDLSAKNKTTTNETKSNIEENKKFAKEQRKAAKELIEAKKAEVDKNPNLTKEQKRNMTKYGASEEYSTLNDKQLDEQIKQLQAQVDESGNGKATTEELETLPPAQKQNIVELGASVEYSNMDNEQLQGKIDELKNKLKQNSSNGMNPEERNQLETDLINFETEQQNRQNYKNLSSLKSEKGSRTKYQEQKKMLTDYKNKKLETVSKVFDSMGQTGNAIMSLLSSGQDKTGNTKKSKNKGSYDDRYLRDEIYLATVSSNENYFGGGHNDDQKRRFKKFAKRI